MIEQSVFPSSPAWLSPKAPDFTGYAQPGRDTPALANVVGVHPLVSVIGTVHDEALPLRRSLRVWQQQRLPDWLRGRVELWILDDGSSDHPQGVVAEQYGLFAAIGISLRYARFREPGSPGNRSCTLVHNAAIRQLVTSPLVMIQWWDRIPGSLRHLAALAEPHRQFSGIATSAISRHIGGSSSMDGMTPEALAARLASVEWADDPSRLERIAGPVGGHCRPGAATESSGLLLPVREFEAVGGFDERYAERAGYVNVELFRRLLQTDLKVLFPAAVVAQNFHQSHAANRVKSPGWLDDPRVVRNVDREWGTLQPIEVV